MTFYAVTDTNVILSSILTANPLSPTIGIIEAIGEDRLVPLYSDYLLDEYKEVLDRSKFRIPDIVRDNMMYLFTQHGIRIQPSDVEQALPDPNDAPIFMIAMETRNLDSYLVTGNIKHFPAVDYVVTPRKMIEILYGSNQFWNRTRLGHCHWDFFFPCALGSFGGASAARLARSSASIASMAL